jgi:hypothetical protein
MKTVIYTNPAGSAGTRDDLIGGLNAPADRKARKKIREGSVSILSEESTFGWCEGREPGDYCFVIDESQARGPSARVRLSNVAGLI